MRELEIEISENQVIYLFFPDRCKISSYSLGIDSIYAARYKKFVNYYVETRIKVVKKKQKFV